MSWAISTEPKSVISVRSCNSVEELTPCTGSARRFRDYDAARSSKWRPGCIYTRGFHDPKMHPRFYITNAPKPPIVLAARIRDVTVWTESGAHRNMHGDDRIRSVHLPVDHATFTDHHAGVYFVIFIDGLRVLYRRYTNGKGCLYLTAVALIIFALVTSVLP